MSLIKFGITQAPSNIALIKYMGKLNSGKNLPENDSLSLTLKNLLTYTFFKCKKSETSETTLFLNEAPVEDWFKEYSFNDSFFHSLKDQWIHPNLSNQEVEKTNRVLQNLKPKCETVLVENGFSLEEPQKIEMRTVNTFPASAGIASSASSQASLTLALFYALVKEKKLLKEKFESDLSFIKKIAAISREASGSSCRSFLGPWVKWSGASIEPVFSNQNKFADILILVNKSKKKVSSSQAHQNVKTSPLWEGRIQRAHERLKNFESFFSQNDLKKCAEISYEEAMDMHELFHSSVPSFSYFEPETKTLLDWYREQIYHETNPPFLTMDAGPNIHLLTVESEVEKWVHSIQKKFPHLEIKVDSQGQGASLDEIQLFTDSPFEIEVPAKWVLSGEHSVLQGKPALTLPLNKYALKLKWIPNNNDSLFNVQPEHHQEIIEKLIFRLQKIIPNEFQNTNLLGTFYLENNIPLKAGLGSSAALSVGLVEFLTRGHACSSKDKLMWAMDLENYFHGKSSGMDVAAVYYKKPLVFKKNEEVQEIELIKSPHFTFHNTSETMATHICVENVLAYGVESTQKAEAFHQKMGDATNLAHQGLVLFQGPEKAKAEDLIARAMQMNLECFYDWGLISEGIHQKIIELKKQNPLAIKLTGAGLGGFLVALWRS